MSTKSDQSENQMPCQSSSITNQQNVKSHEIHVDPLTDVSTVDFLELTSSQESYLFKEIQNMPVPVASNDTIAPIMQTTSGMSNSDVAMSQQGCQVVRNEHFQTMQTSRKFVSPIYNFHNSVVHIHHH